MSDSINFTQKVQISPSAVYYALTNAMALRQWFCDSSSVRAVVGGSYFVDWNIGYYAVGEFTALEADKRVAFTWQGKGEPGVTQVEYTLEPAGDDTIIHLQHSGIGSGETWETVRQQFQENWESALENLKSVLETGLDLRIMRRPMLGVYPMPLTEESAKKLGVPVTEGTHLTGVVDGLGAQAAGLQSGDVIINVDGKVVRDFSSMVAALAPFHGGDTVEVVFYRGSEKHTVNMTLSKRPEPDRPTSPSEFAEALRLGKAEVEAELDVLLAGLPEEIATQRPEPEEWSIKENLAHLIWTEHWNQMWLWGAVGGDDSIPWPDNGAMHLAPTLATHQMVVELLAELKTAHAETVAAAAALPASFIERKASAITMALVLNGLPPHTRQHIDQMRRALESIRAAPLIA